MGIEKDEEISTFERERNRVKVNSARKKQREKMRDQLKEEEENEKKGVVNITVYGYGSNRIYRMRK